MLNLILSLLLVYKSFIYLVSVTLMHQLIISKSPKYQDESIQMKLINEHNSDLAKKYLMQFCA